MSMRKITMAAAFAASATTMTPAFASDKADVLAVVHQYIGHYVGKEGLEEEEAAALCADHTVIIDMFPPYTWNGPGACATWMKESDAANASGSYSDFVVTLGTSPPVIVSGDHAYTAIPARWTYKVKGKPGAPINGIWTYTLQKLPAGWRITGIGWGLNLGN